MGLVVSDENDYNNNKYENNSNELIDGKGLTNLQGQNNCFLNVVIQISINKYILILFLFLFFFF